MQLIIVLDVDETLLHAKTDIVGGRHRPSGGEDAEADFVQLVPLSTSNGRATASSLSITCFLRPGVRQFLQDASQLGSLAIFSAGSAQYVDALLDRIDPGTTLIPRSHRFYRDSCKSDGGKDLSCVVRRLVGMSVDLDRALARTVLIDDLPAALQCQPDNGILVAPFFPANDIGAAAAERRSRADMESRHLAQKEEAADIVRGEAALEEVLALLTAAARERMLGR